MPGSANSITWNDGPEKLLTLATTIETGYLLIEQRPGGVSPGRLASLPHDVVVFCSPVNRARLPRHRSTAAPVLSLISALPDQDPAAAVSSAFLQKHADQLRGSRSLCELVIRAASKGTVAFVELPDSTLPGLIPNLTSPASAPRKPWLRDLIEGVSTFASSGTRESLAALKAGLFLLNDFFDDSHSCSQSIEGQGTHHTGDYWHAILHRREPDYGNSGYWFRHVGRHPVFDDLAVFVQQELHLPDGPSPEQTGRLAAKGRWDPFAFIDLCRAAERDAAPKSWCERVQHEEMLLLLDWSFREAGISA